MWSILLHGVCMNQQQALKMLRGCRRAYKRHKPDIVMYVDRADVIRRNFEDEPLLRTITQVRG